VENKIGRLIKMLEIKMYGLKRSGTNYTQKLLERNYRVKVHDNRGGWKHGPYIIPNLLGKELNCVVVIKQPLAWLVSLYKHLQSPWPFPMFANHYIHEWNSMYFHWLSVKPVQCKIIPVRYECLLQDKRKVCEKVAQQLGLEAKNKEFNLVERIIGPGGKEVEKKFDVSYYVEKKYLVMYSPLLQKKIKSTVYEQLVKILGYNLEEM